MENPLSLWHFYFRNKRKVLPVIGILALAILGVVVTDSLLASARETAYATYGSYQKLILVAPRATRELDLSNPLADSLTQLRDVQLKVDNLDGPGGLTAYYDAVVALPARVRAQLPAVQQLQVDAANARYYAARLRGDLVPLGDLIVRSAVRVSVKQSAGGGAVGRCLVEGIHAEAFGSGHREVSEGLGGGLGLAVMMRQDLSHLGQAVAAAALDLLCDLRMQRRTRFAEQALIERVPHQLMLEDIIARLAVETHQIERLHRHESGIDVGLADRGGQQFRSEPPSDHRGRLQERTVFCRQAVHARGE